jgi:AraC family transcriptional regulator
VGTTQALRTHHLASGDGWTVSDVICTAGPQDQPYEEQHSGTSVAIVVSGTFQYLSATGRELMTPGALLLGNPGEYFCCSHEHGTGDRCLAVSYTPEFFERLSADAGGGGWRFGVGRLPPIRALAPLVAKASALLAGAGSVTCEELSLQLAAKAIEITQRAVPRRAGAEPSSLARVTRVVRMIDHEPSMPHRLRSLAQIARLSPYHFLRMFEDLTGTTPHQYLLRARLRRAAIQLRTESARVLDIALACGFGDVSHFNRSFRSEFGMNPRAYRRKI